MNMPVTMEIVENGRVIVYKYREPFNLRDLNPLYDQDQEYRDTVDFKVHTILDMEGVKKLPDGILGARIGSPVLSHKRSGVIVVVCAESLAKAVANVVLRISRKEAKFFNTAEEGWVFLRQYIGPTTANASLTDQAVTN